MDRMLIRGGVPLRGTVDLSGSKNAALPIMMASVLTDEPLIIRNVPRLRDVRTAMDLLSGLGVSARWIADHEIELDAGQLNSHEAPYELVKTMRASFVALGPLLARCGRARVSTPGGCAIGARPVNLHIAGIRALGARIQLRNGYVEAHATSLTGARIWLDNPSVGATENILMAAVRARGTNRYRKRRARTRSAGPCLFAPRDGCAHRGCRYPCDRNRRGRSPSWRRAQRHRGSN